jgi:hypothetical protein
MFFNKGVKTLWIFQQMVLGKLDIHIHDMDEAGSLLYTICVRAKAIKILQDKGKVTRYWIWQ